MTIRDMRYAPVTVSRPSGAESRAVDARSAPVARVARRDDLEALYRLACTGGDGLTNLPPDRGALAAKLTASEQALVSASSREQGAAILFIVELDGQVVATSCVFPRVGADWPFYSYRLTRQVSRSLSVGRRKGQILLNLVNDFDGECEVGGLFVDPECRGHSVGKLAARARYMFIASHRDWFGRKVIAELRGYQDANGKSPVWDAIGRHFYEMEFSEADRTGALSGNQFIADLGPRYPLYVSMLTMAAQEALGQPHNEGRPALQMLLDEGFIAGEYVDIFDGGPTLVADIDQVRSIARCHASVVQSINQPGDDAVRSFVAFGTGPDFRVTQGLVTGEGGIEPSLASGLGLKIGDTFLCIPT